MRLQYWVVDAFTDHVFAGNPAAVVLPEVRLPEALMQRIAAENNLSETAFAMPEGEGWRLRWFTPTVEVDLCGHATLATSFVLASQGHAGPHRFQTRSGMLTATPSGEGIELDFPAVRFDEIATPAEMASALGVVPVAVFNSLGLIAVLDSPEQVASLKPDIGRIAAMPGGSLAVTAAGGAGGADVTSRYFAPGYGIDEDPVTGSLHTRLVPYWAEKLGRTTLVCRQASARGGTMVCELRGSRVTLRGTAVLYASGEMHLPSADG